MRKLISLLLIAISAIPVLAQAPQDTVSRAVDSLFIRASNGNVMYADLVQPSRKALADMGTAAMPRLVEKMSTQDAREMQTLEDVFKLIGHPAVIYLVDALGSDNVYRRRLSSRILGELADSSSVPGLLRYANDSDFRLRAGVVSALGKIGDRRGLAPSLAALNDGDYLVRTSAAISLSNLKESSSINGLIEALSDPYYGVRFSAAAALSNIGKPVIGPVFDALREPSDTLAFYLLIEVAGNLVDNKFIEILSRIINSNDPYARAFAAEALGKIGSSDAIKTLHRRYEVETNLFVISKIESVVLD